MIYHEMFGNYCVSQDYRVIPVISVFDWFHATLETQKNTGPQGSLKFSGTKKSEPHRNSRRFWMRVVFSPAWPMMRQSFVDDLNLENTLRLGEKHPGSR